MNRDGGTRAWLLVLALPSGCGAADEADASGSAADEGVTAPSSGVDGTGGSASADATSNASAATMTSADETRGEGPTIFDVGDEDTRGESGESNCDCGNQIGFSYIWIANSSQGTVTKLNTQTMIEEGRYLTRADGLGNPSRTSVSIDSRAVAVANRSGGLIKIWALPEFCDPMANGQAGLQTADDLDYLPWGEDDCVAWFTAFDYTTQRPVAWGPGALDRSSCEFEGQVVWTAGCSNQQWAQVHRVDGDTGVVLDTIDVTGFECSVFSPYGGAVDQNGDFWMSNYGPGSPPSRLAHIAADGTLVEVISPPVVAYGIAVDSNGRVWLASAGASAGASAARYSPDSGTWDLADDHVANAYSGIQQDSLGRMWMNYWTYDGVGPNSGLVYIDSETMAVGPPFDIGCGPSSCRGVSVDLDGNVWSTSMGENRAFRFDPDTLQLDTYDQLVFPYTYSDMTGWALQNTACDPEG
jgi:sugar lactone lactonase YvrE